MKSKWKIAKTISIILIVVMVLSQVAMSFATAATLEGTQQPTTVENASEEDVTADVSEDSDVTEPNAEGSEEVADKAVTKDTEGTAEGDAASEEPKAEGEEQDGEIDMPEQTLTATAEDGAVITVKAPKGALPEGTTLSVEKVEAEEVKDAVEEVAGETVKKLAAYNIT
ncbi:MAG: hypothetical protein Q4C25_08995, partial [Bacillota bacterium]|nr:hypothetical protein [Bacillota bacterium]